MIRLILLVLALHFSVLHAFADESNWRNYDDPLDVNDDGNVSVFDLYILLANFEQRGRFEFTNETTPPYLDVNNDLKFGPRDIAMWFKLHPEYTWNRLRIRDNVVYLGRNHKLQENTWYEIELYLSGGVLVRTFQLKLTSAGQENTLSGGPFMLMNTGYEWRARELNAQQWGNMHHFLHFGVRTKRTCNGKTLTQAGSSFDEILIGTDEADVIMALAGQNEVRAYLLQENQPTRYRRRNNPRRYSGHRRQRSCVVQRHRFYRAFDRQSGDCGYFNDFVDINLCPRKASR